MAILKSCVYLSKQFRRTVVVVFDAVEIYVIVSSVSELTAAQ